MKPFNAIFAYYQKICDGSVTVGKWVRLLYGKIIEDLEAKRLVFDQKKANNAIEWIETHTFHTKGPKAPGPFLLELWQKAFVSCIFGLINPEDGKRQFREVVLVVARKNGKSLLAAAIAKYMLQVEGGYGAEIYTIAPKLEQAAIIYDSVWHMFQLDPEWKALKEAVEASKDEHNKKTLDDSMLCKKRVSDLYIAGTNSSMKKLAWNAKQSDGFNGSLTICDETASWDGDRGLKVYEVMKSMIGAREMGDSPGIILSCSTAGYINDGIYDEMLKRATRYLLGDSKERRLLPLLYMSDDVDKWNDINEVAKANPNLGVSVSVNYLLDEIAVAEGSLSKKREFVTKYCCLKQNSSMAWLDAKAVEDMGGPPLKLEDFRNSYCVGGIDLSQTTDLTSCCVVIEKNGQLFVFSKFFLPAERIQDAIQKDGVPYDIFMQRGLLQASGQNFVDYHDCYNWFVELVEKWQILPLQIGYDRYSAQYLVQDMTAYGFHMDDVFQGDNLHGVIQETQGLIEDRKIHVGDNDLLKSHLLNSALKVSVERGRGKLVKLRPTLHIDGVAALLDAMTVRQKHYGEIGEQLKNVTV